MTKGGFMNVHSTGVARVTHLDNVAYPALDAGASILMFSRRVDIQQRVFGCFHMIRVAFPGGEEFYAAGKNDEEAHMNAMRNILRVLGENEFGGRMVLCSQETHKVSALAELRDLIAPHVKMEISHVMRDEVFAGDRTDLMCLSKDHDTLTSISTQEILEVPECLRMPAKTSPFGVYNVTIDSQGVKCMEFVAPHLSPVVWLRLL